jgi:hypothetical protein
MNNKVKLVIFQYNGMMKNVAVNPKILREITASEKFTLYGFYDEDISSNIKYDNQLFIYGRKCCKNNEYKLNRFELPKPKSFIIPKIYGDIFLLMYNFHNCMYEDFTTNMWNRISIKK